MPRPVFPGLPAGNRLLGQTPTPQPVQTFAASAPGEADLFDAMGSFAKALFSTHEGRTIARDRRLAQATSLAYDPEAIKLISETAKKVESGELDGPAASKALFTQLGLRDMEMQGRYEEVRGEAIGRGAGGDLKASLNDPALLELSQGQLNEHIAKKRDEMLANPFLSGDGVNSSIGRENAIAYFEVEASEFRLLADQRLAQRDATVVDQATLQKLTAGEKGTFGLMHLSTANTPSEQQLVNDSIIDILDREVPKEERANKLAEAGANQVRAYAAEGKYAEAEIIDSRMRQLKLSNGLELGQASGEAAATLSALASEVQDYDRLQLAEDDRRRDRLDRILTDAALAEVDAASKTGDPKAAIQLAINAAMDANPNELVGLSQEAQAALATSATVKALNLANGLQEASRDADLRAIERLAIVGDEQALINFNTTDRVVRERANAAAEGREARVVARDKSTSRQRAVAALTQAESTLGSLPPEDAAEFARLRAGLVDIDAQFVSAGPAADPETLGDDAVRAYEPALQSILAFEATTRTKLSTATSKESEVLRLLAADDVAGGKAAFDLALPFLGDDAIRRLGADVGRAQEGVTDTTNSLILAAEKFGTPFVESLAVEGEDPANTTSRILTFQQGIADMASTFVKEQKDSGLTHAEMRERMFKLGPQLAKRWLTEEAGESPDKFLEHFPKPPTVLEQAAAGFGSATFDAEGRDFLVQAIQEAARNEVKGTAPLEAAVTLALDDVKAVYEGDRGSLFQRETRDPLRRLWDVTPGEPAKAVYVAAASTGSFSLEDLAIGSTTVNAIPGRSDLLAGAQRRGVAVPAFGRGIGRETFEPIPIGTLGSLRDVSVKKQQVANVVGISGTFGLPEGDVGKFFAVSVADIETGLSAGPLYDRAVAKAGGDATRLLKALGAKDKKEAIVLIEAARERQKAIMEIND